MQIKTTVTTSNKISLVSNSRLNLVLHKLAHIQVLATSKYQIISKFKDQTEIRAQVLFTKSIKELVGRDQEPQLGEVAMESMISRRIFSSKWYPISRGNEAKAC
jgi:hypothetical protein